MFEGTDSVFNIKSVQNPSKRRIYPCKIQTDYQFPICNTKRLKNGKLRKAILSAILSEIFVQACLYQNFT